MAPDDEPSRSNKYTEETADNVGPAIKWQAGQDFIEKKSYPGYSCNSIKGCKFVLA